MIEKEKNDVIAILKVIKLKISRYYDREIAELEKLLPPEEVPNDP